MSTVLQLWTATIFIVVVFILYLSIQRRRRTKSTWWVFGLAPLEYLMWNSNLHINEQRANGARNSVRPNSPPKLPRRYPYGNSPPSRPRSPVHLRLHEYQINGSRHPHPGLDNSVHEAICRPSLRTSIILNFLPQSSSLRFVSSLVLPKRRVGPARDLTEWNGQARDCWQFFFTKKWSIIYFSFCNTAKNGGRAVVIRCHTVNQNPLLGMKVTNHFAGNEPPTEYLICGSGVFIPDYRKF